MAVECDVLLLGPTDATGRLLRALLMTSGLGVSHAATEREATEAARSTQLKVIVTYTPAGFGDEWLDDLLGSPLFAELPIVAAEEATPAELDAVVRKVAAHCDPLSP